MIARYKVSGGLDEFFAAVNNRINWEEEAFSDRKTTFLDTFDGRLHAADLLLRMEETGGLVWLILTDRKGNRLHRHPAKSVPEFAWDLPSGDFREKVESAARMRRLFTVAATIASGRFLTGLNDSQEMVVGVVLHQRTARPRGRGKGRKLALTLEIVEVLGYEEEFQAVREVASGQAGLEPCAEDELAEIVRLFGGGPLNYSSKLKLELDLAMTAREALVKIHSTLFDVMLRNEEGVRKDWDPEFLHDFRVAGRRIRCALTQIKGVFPEEQTEALVKEFSWLGSATGPVRDLDVYLLNLHDYRASFPDRVGDDLRPLEKFLQSLKKKEHKLLVKVLSSERYRKLKEGWPEFLSNPDRRGGRNAGRPIASVASKRIWKVYRRIVKRRGEIKGDGSPEVLHALRLECKKLRYLLEFFRSLYESSETKQLIKSLKSLQDSLGDFNDFEIQKRKLDEFARIMIEEDPPPPETLLALGRLIERLNVRQKEEQKRFLLRYKHFVTTPGRKRVKELFRLPAAAET